jgi:SAM-dependent methyltransferase
MEVRALAAALDAADEHGLLHDLAERPASAEQLAARHGLDPIGCARVLAILQTNGFIEPDGAQRDGAAYRVPPAVRHELRGPDALTRGGGRFWAHATAFLATGAPLRPHDLAERSRAYAEATPHLARIFEPLAARLAAGLAERLARDAAILDVGAGSGVWSLALVERLPHARARAVDLPGVLPRFLERAAALGVAARVEAVAGDYHDSPTAERFAVVLLANVLHIEPAPAAARLIERWAGAVADDGLLVVVDMLSERGEEPAHAAYALHLAMRVPGAYPHLEPELRGWLAAAGFGRVERVGLDDDAPLVAALVAARGPCP